MIDIWRITINQKVWLVSIVCEEIDERKLIYNTQKLTHSKNTPTTIPRQYPSMDTSKQSHSQNRKDNMHSLHT